MTVVSVILAERASKVTTVGQPFTTAVGAAWKPCPAARVAILRGPSPRPAGRTHVLSPLRV